VNLVLMLLAAGQVLGPPIRQEAFTLRPPAAFRMARLDLFHGSRVGTVAHNDDVPRRLLAALVDTDGEDAASLMLSSVDEPFKVSASARDELSAEVARHFGSELGLKFSLEKAEVVPGAAPHVEVSGSVREGSQLRQIVVAAWAGEVKHPVVIFTVPSGRYAALADALRASLDSFHVDAPTAAASRAVAWAVAALVASALMASIGLWRRRRGATPP
jgi:hypothetical protein